MKPKKTLVIGASDNPARYSYLALQRLSAQRHPIIAIGKKPGKVQGITIETEPPALNDIDTVTLYIHPRHQPAYYNYILSIKPQRIIFNPGAENLELKEMAEAAGIETLQACTLVMLATGQY